MSISQKFYKFAGLFAFAAVTGLTGCTQTAHYECGNSDTSIMVIGESASTNALLPESVMYERIAANLEANLTREGYGIVGRQSLVDAYPEYFSRRNIRHDDKALVDLARTHSRNKLDVLAVTEINAQIDTQQYHSNVTSTVGVRLLSVKDGTLLGEFELDNANSTSIRPSCKDECLDEAVVDNAKPLTLNVAALVAKALACPGSRSYKSDRFDQRASAFETAYELVFDGFTAQDMLKVEEYLVDFSGYQAHRIVYSGATRTKYWYESSIKSSALNKNLYLVLERLGMRGVVQFSGNTYTVKKVTLRGGSTQTTKPSKKYEW